MGAKLEKLYKCECGLLICHSVGAFDSPPLRKKCPCGKIASAYVSTVAAAKKARKQSSSRNASHSYESESFFDFSFGGDTGSSDTGGSD